MPMSEERLATLTEEQDNALRDYQYELEIHATKARAALAAREAYEQADTVTLALMDHAIETAREQHNIAKSYGADWAKVHDAGVVAHFERLAVLRSDLRRADLAESLARKRVQFVMVRAMMTIAPAPMLAYANSNATGDAR